MTSATASHGRAQPRRETSAGSARPVWAGRSSTSTTSNAPPTSHRENFTEVVMLPVLRERLKVINPWLENDQIDEVVKRLTASFPGRGLLENNRHVFNLLWRTPASARTVKRARRVRRSIS